MWSCDKIEADRLHRALVCALCPPDISWITEVDLSKMARGSIATANKKGDKGQPCLVPLYNGKYCKLVLFVIMEQKGNTYKSFTQVRKFGPTPNLSRQLKRSTPLYQSLFQHLEILFEPGE